MGVATSLYENEDDHHRELKHRVNKMHGKVKKWDSWK